MAPADDRDDIDAELAHIIPRQPFPQYVDDAVFLEVSSLLDQHPDMKPWKDNPRLYTLLRMLGYHHDSAVFERFRAAKISDFWLPLNDAVLKQLSAVGFSPKDCQNAQRSLRSNPNLMNGEKLLTSAHAQIHRHIRDGNAYFKHMEKIGEGGTAEVVRVHHPQLNEDFACKRIRRATSAATQRSQASEFEREVEALRRLDHQHVVSLIASFTDETYFSFILKPVAKDTLKSMLERQSRESPLPDADISTLRRTFGCLATTLAYLHDTTKIRHKDIKPGNILLSGGLVYLCDFGISLDWSEAEHAITEGVPLRYTARYSAPEVPRQEARDTKSDIWSLGFVFLEILSVIKGWPLDEVVAFLRQPCFDAKAQNLWCAPEAIHAWLVKLRTNDSADDLPLDWITPMMRTEPSRRLAASELVAQIQEQCAKLEDPGLFIGPCCTRRPESITPVAWKTPKYVPDSHLLPEPPPKDDRTANSASPSSNHRLVPPPRDSTPSSIDRGRNPPGRRNGSRGGSVSPDSREKPYTRSRGSTDTGPFPTDPPSDTQSGTSGSSPYVHKPSFSDSQGTPSFDSGRGPLQRSPVPPLPSFGVKCLCAAKSDEQRIERHIFNASYTSPQETEGSRKPIEFTSSNPTVETCAKCEMPENRIQVYETLPHDPGHTHSTMPMIWWVTRRLVVSYLTGTPEFRHCSSFWLPLSDLQFVVSEDGTEITLHWSDCNQMIQRRSPNYGQHYDWCYDPKSPNNHLTLQFNTEAETQKLIEILRLPYEDGQTVSHGQSVKISDSSQLNVFDVGRTGVRNYRVATLTNYSPMSASSKLFIMWPEVDLDVRIFDSRPYSQALPEYRMQVDIKNVATPTYHSDVRGEPAADYGRVAHFNRALQVKANLAMTFEINGMNHGLPSPPPAAVAMLRSLSGGWTLCYFAIVTEFRTRRRHFGWRKYDKADVMLWEKEVDDSALSVRRRGSMITIRLHKETHLLWVTGAITTSSSIANSKCSDATVVVFNRRRGKLLDLGKMTAIESEAPKAPARGHSRSTSDTHEDRSELELSFETAHYCDEFVKLIADFRRLAAATNPLTRTATNPESIRRVGSLASDYLPMSPPMR